MADFRNIHTRIWADSWFSELLPDEKLLFIYLFSNPNASVCGMYEMPKRNMAMDTGIPLDRVNTILENFASDGKVFYDHGIVWVVNLKKYNDNGDSSKVQARATKDLENIPETHIKKMYYEHYKIPYPELQIPYPENAPETETETLRDETETETRPLESFEAAQKAIERITGLPPDREAEKHIEALVAMKATAQDIQEGYNWLIDNHKTFQYYSQLVGPTKTAIAKRIQAGKSNGRVKPPVYSEVHE